MTPAVARADAAPQTVERRVLAIVRTLVDELGGLKGRGPVALDDALDRDLGLGSLERVELLVRIEQGLRIQLWDAAMAEAATARELVHAVLMARGSRATEPAAAATLTEVLGFARGGRPRARAHRAEPRGRKRADDHVWGASRSGLPGRGRPSCRRLG
jgi:acyl carrier protein